MTTIGNRVPAPTGPEGTWLVDPKQSLVGTWLVRAMAILQVLGAGALLVQAEFTLVTGSLAAILVLSGALFTTVSRTLGAAKGGARLLADGETLALYGKSRWDEVRVKAEEIAGLQVIRRQEFWGKSEEPVFVSSVEVIRTDGTGLFLLEYNTLEDAQEAALTFRNATGWPLLTEAPAATDARPDPRRTPGLSLQRRAGCVEVSMRPGPRYGLAGPTLALALFSLVTGILMLASVRTTGVVGFLFGPFLAALGTICLGLWAVRAFAREHILLEGSRLRCEYRLAGRTFAARQYEIGEDGMRARLRSRGAVGFSLEWVVGNRVCAVGTGATRASHLTPEDLLFLASACGQSL